MGVVLLCTAVLVVLVVMLALRRTLRGPRTLTRAGDTDLDEVFDAVEAAFESSDGRGTGSGCGNDDGSGEG